MESKYGVLALWATDAASKGISPLKAWEAAAERVFPTSPSSQHKPCPKSTFLGLAEAGRIAGIPAGMYTRSTENKRYALNALGLLQQNQYFELTPALLWYRVMAIEGVTKRHNCQMDVVIALWHAKKFVGQSA